MADKGEVSGRRTVGREKSKRTVVMRREDLDQLVLELTAASRAAPTPMPAKKTFGELAADWLRRIAPVRVCPDNERRHVRHLTPLLHLREGQLTKGAIDDLFAQLRGGLSAATVNKLRGTGRLIVRDAQGNNEWDGNNPFELVRRMRQSKRVYVTLTINEVRRVLAALINRPDKRRLVRTCAQLGLRPGEAFALLKVDVDLEHAMMRVCRSHGRDQTKTGREREFPIPDELLPVLHGAIQESKTEYVFPGPDGGRYRADTKLTRMFRKALVEALVVTGYQYTCAHVGCGHTEVRPTVEPLDCPNCGFRLRRRGIPKPVRFYDLRHTCATLHRQAGCDPLVIQELLGHASNLTDGTYTHLDDSYRRDQLNKLKLG